MNLPVCLYGQITAVKLFIKIAIAVIAIYGKLIK